MGHWVQLVLRGTTDTLRILVAEACLVVWEQFLVELRSFEHVAGLLLDGLTLHRVELIVHSRVSDFV